MLLPYGLWSRTLGTRFQCLTRGQLGLSGRSELQHLHAEVMIIIPLYCNEAQQQKHKSHALKRHCFLSEAFLFLGVLNTHGSHRFWRQILGLAILVQLVGDSVRQA